MSKNINQEPDDHFYHKEKFHKHHQKDVTNQKDSVNDEDNPRSMETQKSMDAENQKAYDARQDSLEGLYSNGNDSKKNVTGMTTLKMLEIQRIDF